jgi:TolB-like protein/class 3 adenylate cyclase/Flp pilus assembly protein TadD
VNTEEFKRRLTAILSADVEGYSRLMTEDEESTIRTLTTYRTGMTNLILQYRGRVVDSPGDNLLAEFASAVDAVNCAAEIQRELAERNAELAPERRMEFRIGINVGDVVEEEKRIYGDGVNIAARMEGLAEGGGICISGTAYDQVKNKLDLEYEYLGEQEVKNIKEPVRVYRALSFPGAAAHRVVKAKKAVGRTWRNVVVAIGVFLVVGAAVVVWRFYFRPSPIETASVDRMAQPLPDKPSVAVLPFVNMSGDPEQEYFADGLTEEIIAALSKVPRLFVIARNSSFTYKGKPVKVQQVSEDLGVQYVLEGSVRKAGKRVRVTAQLIDALNGRHLWAETYDRELKDIFALQDQITFKVVAALQVKLTEGEQALIVAARTNNFEAYAKFLLGLEYVKGFNREGNLLARKVAEEAIDLDPNYPRGYRLLATTHWLDVRLGISKAPKQSLNEAAKLYRKVIAMHPSDAQAQALLGIVYTMMRQHKKGIAEAEKAVAISPNAADAHAMYGYVLHFSGRHSEAIDSTQKAIRLNPFPPNWYFSILGMAYCHTGLHKEAIAAFKKALHFQPDSMPFRLNLAAAYSLSNDERSARAEIEKVLRLNPNYCVQIAAKAWPYKNRADKERSSDALRKAGLPETPPLPLPDKPSIAVLPFVNMSGDPEQEYFSDGITEEIITALSKVPDLFVIARNSTFTYKGKPVKVQQVGRELGVRYVLEGSVRKAEDKVRVTAQLVDAVTGKHLWAERYDRDLKDIFALQDEITMKIITELQVKLTEGERVRGYAKGTDNLEAYLKFLQGGEHYRRLNKEDNARARQMCEEAIALDPQYPQAYATLGWTHWIDVWLKSSRSPRESISKAFELAQKSISLDDSCPSGHLLLSNLYLMTRQHEKAIAEGEKAIALDPNSADAYAIFGGQVLVFSGKPEEGALLVEKAIRLNPIAPSYYLQMLGMAYRETGRYEESITACKKAIKRRPNNIFAHLILVAAYSMLGQEDTARATAAEVLRIDPEFSVEHFAKTRPHIDPANTARFAEALRKAGLR